MKKSPEYTDIENAAKTILGHARKTPLLESTVLNEITGASVLVKPRMPAGNRIIQIPWCL